jgi:hypothetical protein
MGDSVAFKGTLNCTAKKKIFLRNLTYFRHMMYIESDAFKGTFKCAIFSISII